MARIDIRDRTLTLKIVYYGPAMGGKTTNLHSLHGFIDPARRPDLLSLDTQGDRTLFFDLLPLDLDDICGFKVKVRLFTVPGQVHYNATRRLVLRGADAAVFVADSVPNRLAANSESLRTLHENLAANGLAPGSVPIVLQANKRDVDSAASMVDVETSLGREALAAHGDAVMPGLIAAAALAGRGVFETFEKALRVALASAYKTQGLAKAGATREAMGFALSEALEPMRARSATAVRAVSAPAATATMAQGPPRVAHRVAAGPSTAASEEALAHDKLFDESVRRALVLAESLGDAQASELQMARRVRELETIQELSRVLVNATTLPEVMQAVAVAARLTLGDKGAASILVEDSDGVLRALGLSGVCRDPLSFAGSPPLAVRIHRAARPVIHRHIETDLVSGDSELMSALAPYCTLVACPVRLPSGGNALVIAYGQDPESPADPAALRFISLVAAQAALGLQAVDRHVQLVRNSEALESEVAARTAELRAAHAELAASSRLKDRILTCVNHELRTPVTKVLAAAQVIQRCKGGEPPPQMIQQVVEQARHLGTLLDQVLTAQALLAADTSSVDGPEILDMARIVDAAVFACQDRAAARRVVVHVTAPGDQALARVDAGAVTLILAQILDNAVKFTKPGTEVHVRTEVAGNGTLRVIVRDAGPGVKPGDVERIFGEFDQGSGDVLTAKPNGLGLGLAIARRLARRLGGEVGTLPMSEGAEFWLELPAHAGAPARPVTSARETVAAGA